MLTLVTGAALAVSAARFVAGRGGDEAPPADTRVPVTRIVPAAGQSFVTGEIESLSADDAQTTPIPVPFTLTSVDRGAGKGTIENALVDGKRTTIFWGGGTPLPLSGTGGVDVTGAVVDVDVSGLTWTISGGRKLLPGSYQAGAPVAVGATGLAASRDSVSFVADDRTVLNTTGGVVVKLDPQPLEVTGPGRVSATGTLTVTDTSGSRAASSIDFDTGPYRLSVVPQGAKLVLDATLQRKLTAT
ncbi:MAG: hypothetical protein QOE93_2364 [Actinomycetota bacterium]|nr:hypothetical protein [Actinomycetota bacterium]